MTGATRLLARVWQGFGAPPERLEGVRDPVGAVPLWSKLSVGDLAWASVAAVALASGRRGAELDELDPARIAVAYRSDRVLHLDGRAPSVWSAYSAFWQTADGWIRTHGNYPHHAAALCGGLGLDLSAGSEEISAAVAGMRSGDVAQQITGAGGLAVAVAPERPEFDARLRASPVVDIRRVDGTRVRAQRDPADRRSPASASSTSPASSPGPWPLARWPCWEQTSCVSTRPRCPSRTGSISTRGTASAQRSSTRGRR